MRKNSWVWLIVVIAFVGGVALAEIARPFRGKSDESDEVVSATNGAMNVNRDNDREQSPTRQGSVKLATDNSTGADIAETAAPLIHWQNELEFLREEADVAREERQSLIEQVDTLRAELSALASLSDGNPISSESTAVDNQENLAVAANLDIDSIPNDALHSRARGSANTPREQYQNLLAAGIDQQSAEDIQQRSDSNQLARLELYDQATREGWLDSDDFSKRLSELESGRVDIRLELGDANYDRYLFAAGRNNRVAIASVIGGSAAQLAGIISGDRVLSYANQRVFTMRELQGATREGSRGEYVQITLQRDLDTVVTELPRGPLGVTLAGSRFDPG